VRPWLASSLLAALALVAVGVTPAAAKLHPYRTHIFQGAGPGSRAGFFKISADEIAVGQRLLATGLSQPLIFNPRPTGAGSSLAGVQGALVAIDAQDEMVGTYFGPAGAQPLYLAGVNAQPKTLAVSGNANAVALGHLVAVTATGAGGLQHILVWNPVTGAVHDLGPGKAFGISVDGVVYGQTLAGQAAYWTPNSGVHVLSFPGVLLHGNLLGQVVGFTTQSGGPRPILWDKRRPAVVTRLALPSGWAFGSAKDISNTGHIVGTAYQKPTAGLPSEGLVWRKPNNPVPVQRLVRRHIPAGFQVSDASGIDDNGLIVGAVLRTPTRTASGAHGRAAQDMTEEEDTVEEEEDTPKTKIKDGLAEFTFDRDLPSEFPSTRFNELMTRLEDQLGGLSFDQLKSDAETSTRTAVCNTLDEVDGLFKGLTVTPDEEFTTNDLEALKYEGAQDVNGLREEFGCPPTSVTQPELPPLEPPTYSGATA
jgi:hypothetical protein